jgi:hypothetical protein
MRLPIGEGVGCGLVTDCGGRRDLFICLTVGVCSITVGLSSMKVETGPGDLSTLFIQSDDVDW